MLDTIFPVGSMYTQYPGALSPKEIFEKAGYTGSEWIKCFNDEGITFRTEGGGATAFGGGVQQDAMQRIKSWLHMLYYNSNITDDSIHKISESSVGRPGSATSLDISTIYQGISVGMFTNMIMTIMPGNKTMLELMFDSGRVARVSDETRMKNRTFRIWKRIK